MADYMLRLFTRLQSPDCPNRQKATSFVETNALTTKNKPPPCVCERAVLADRIDAEAADLHAPEADSRSTIRTSCGPRCGRTVDIHNEANDIA